MKNSNNKFKKRLMKLSVIALLGLVIPITSLVMATDAVVENDESEDSMTTTGGLEIDVLHQGLELEVISVEKEPEPEPQRYIMAFSASKSSPRMGDFIGGTGRTASIYSESSGGYALTYIEPAPRSSGVVPILDESANRYKIALSGLIGWVDKTELRAVPYTGVKGNDYYYVNDKNELIHAFSNQGSTSTTYALMNQGKAPSYLARNKRYISYDGKYFYNDNLDGINRLVKDYNASETARPNSINSTNPFYNYFQYLPVRTQSLLTSADYRKYLTNNGTVRTNRLSSSLYDVEKDFVDMGNFFGSNPTLGFVTAIHESGFGASNLARNRNNFFGHNAVDSDPNKAKGYLTPAVGSYAHFSDFINWSYSNIHYTYYNGGFVGNKKIGMNVKYASDPYWGEKIAAHYYNMDQGSGGKDYGLYTLGRIKTTNAKLYKDASTTSGSPARNKDGTPRQDSMIAITETLTRGGKKWYKFTAESMLDGNKDYLRWTSDGSKLELPFIIANSQLYIEADNVDIVYQGKGTSILTQTQKKIKKSPTLEKTEKTIVTTKDTNLKADWSNDYSTTFVIPKGTEIKEARFTNNGWVYVIANYKPTGSNYVGFITADSVKVVDESTPPPTNLPKPGNIKYKVNASNGLNLRAAPINGSVVTAIPHNTIVTGGTPLNGWVHVNYNGRTGYVSSDFLTKVDEGTKPKFHKYDLNEDSKVNILDMMLIRVAILEPNSVSNEKKKIYDLNGDNKINILDMMLIRVHILNN